jgi:molybdopterin synthase catalytic subunit
VRPPAYGDDWIGLSHGALPVEAAYAWAVRPECGAVVSFVGTVRDHAEGRSDVTAIEYEAYTEQVEPRLAEVAAQTRRRWQGLGRLVLLHRVGRLLVTEASVVVVASAPHRGEAFDAARFAIDAVKTTVPIWKAEHWAGGVDWGTDAHEVVGAEETSTSSVAETSTTSVTGTSTSTVAETSTSSKERASR